ncbi:DUF6701 domain-containing protein [Roseateles sp. DB2]|uniref:DUF6701 domain-containing protein n=1 Tax=Roseateles sp. DB2 TaxID=3453717 RepID=UPI003EEB8E3A
MNPSRLLSPAFLLTLVLVLAMFLAQPVQAQCGPIPTDNALTAGSGGSLSLPGDFLVNGLSPSGSGPNLPTTGVRNNNATTFPPLVPSSFPSFSSSTTSSSSPLAAGTYSTVNASGSFSTTGGTYYIVNFNVASGSTITLGAGTYYVYNWTIGNNVSVVLSGAVKIYMGNYLSVGNSFLFNAAGPTANGLIELGSNADAGFGNYNTFRGVIYGTSGNSIIMGNNATLTGLIAIKGSLSFAGGSSITLSAADQTAIGDLSTCDPTSLGLVADYHFDECSYNGSAGEARDSRGSYHATSSGARPSTAAGGVVGRYLNTNALNTYLTTGSKVPLSGAYTISTWYLTPFAIDNTNNIHSLAALEPVSGNCIGDFLYTRDNDAYRWRVYTNASGPSIGSQVLNLASGWHHIALVGSGSNTLLYLDGSYRETLGQRINSASSSYGLRYIGSSCDSLAQQAFRAPLDEFMVFNTALSASDISTLYTYQRAGKNWDGTARNLNSCVPAAASFVISGTGSASTCTPQQLTITVKDASGNTITGYTGTITLRSSSGMGTWAKGSSPTPGGNLTAGANNGQASYTFVSGDAGVAKFTLSHSAARDLTVLVTDTGNLANTSSATIQFRDNAFVWSEDLFNKVSGSWLAVAGRSHDMKLTLWKKDPTTGTCSVANDYTGNRNLKLWRTDSGGPWTAPSVASPALSIPAAKPGSSNITLSFSAGVSSFNLGTTDVGQYALSVADETGTYASNAISGTASPLTVRPFAIVISGIKMGSTNNPNGSAATEAVFGAAGADFSATVAAYRWSSTADTLEPGDATGATLNDGVPDATASFAAITAGGIAPGFAATVTLQAASGSPALGSLNNGSIAVTGGTKTVNNLQYTEVGGFQFEKNNVLSNYLGTVSMGGYFFNAAGGQNTTVGRFIPASFAVSNGKVDHRSTAACSPTSSFSYLGENFQLTFDLEARNALGGKTLNYTGDYAKLNLAAPANLGPAGIAGSTLFRTGDRLTAVSSSGTWASGKAEAVTLVLNAARATGAGGASSPDGPFTASFGILPSDGEVSGVNLPDLDTDFPANGKDRGLVATVALRYGRLRLQNAIGSQHRTLSLPLQAQFWDGSVYQLNTLDSCTRITSSQISFGNYRKTMTSTDASVLNSPITLSQGRALITLAKPGTNRSGSYDLALALGSSATDASCLSWTPSPAASSGANLSHLRWPWCGTAADKDPSARASFGLYTGTDSIIYQREN